MKDFKVFFNKELRLFMIIWFGQLISSVGSAMTSFALIIWAYELTGKAGTLAMLGFYSCITFVLASLVAGGYVDRWDRRKVMMISDLGAGMMTLLLLLLYLSGKLQIWHLYMVEGVSGVFRAFQSPAYFASVTLIVPPKHLMRVNGMNSLSNYASTALAPIFAGLLLHWTGIKMIFLVDLATMFFAVFTLMMVQIPRPAEMEKSTLDIRGALRESKFGISYIRRHPGLLGILCVHFCINLFGTISYFAVLSPMILARSGGDTMALSAIQTIMGVGGIVGALLVSVWGGTRKKIHTYLASTAISFFVCDFLLAVGRTLPIWMVAGAFSTITIPFITSPYYAIWQMKIPPEIQGRVFSVRDMFQIASQPVGYLVGGFLADMVFEPAMNPGGWLAPALQGLVGSGPGAGMASMFLLTCVLGTMTGLSGFFIPAIRNVETDVPDSAFITEYASGSSAA